MRGTLVVVALAVATACCGEDVPGIEVRFELRGQSQASDPESSISRALLTVTALELRPCVTAVSRHDALRWLLRTAHAHSPTTPTRLGVPTVVDLRGVPVYPGVVRPPPGRYCSLRWEVGPADQDALGLAQVPQMHGRSAELLAGPITARTAARASGELPLPSWALTAPGPAPFVVAITHDLGVLLEGLAQSGSEEDAGRRLLANLPRALSVKLP